MAADSPNIDPQPGQVLTYNGPAIDASWEDSISIAQFELFMVLWFQSLPTSPGSSGTFWNNGDTIAYIP